MNTPDIASLPEWVRRLQQEIPLAPMKNGYWLTRDEVAYFLAALSAAHAAEVAEGREAYQQRTRDYYAQGDAYDLMRARAEATEQDARLLAASLAGAFAALGMTAPLPIMGLLDRYTSATEAIDACMGTTKEQSNADRS